MKKDSFIIENRFLAVKIETKKGKIKSFSLLNKRTGDEIKGADGSQLFKISFKGKLFSSRIICADELAIADVRSEKENDCEKLIFSFAPVRLKGGNADIALTYELCENDWFIRKYLSFAPQSGCEAVLDYVDYAPIKRTQSLKTWCLPKQEKSHISGFALSLGQPVFVSSAFYGCEFPACVNTVEDDLITVKYYSGKPLARLAKEGGVYHCVKAVIGVADADSDVRLRTALFEYIETISKPIKLRSQYNSWYDHMLNITADNIQGSFLEIEKAMTGVGSKVLDCYVVDDGWNDYEKDFWCFNSKFPNEFYPPSNLVKAFGSKFGMWLGPRGGYTTDTVKFARRIEKGGNGYFNKSSLDIDVGSDRYIKKTKALMLDFQKRFDLTYWKLDGFIQKPCKSKKHDHIHGGKNDMYYYSEVWAKWIDVFQSLEEQSENGVFINLTCYAPPSPWFLQWVNSMWMQISDDHGMIDKDENGKKQNASDKDKLLTYRDDRYYDFSRERRFCFPLSNIYNHDPIYANEIDINMTDGEFREYLFSMAARGTLFWELYYSYSKLGEEKWRINNSVLLFLEENLYMLKNSVMFGGRPGLCQVYGYGCFDKEEGIVMLRNPSSAAKDYVLSLDHSIGAEKTLKNAKAVDLLPYSVAGEYGSYSFGDTLNIHLAPYQTRLIHFGKKVRVLAVNYIKPRSENTLEVMFNQTVAADDITCKENKIKEIRLLDDYRTVLLTFENRFEKENRLTLSNIKDILLYDSERVLEFEYHEGGVIESGVIKGPYDFSITATTGGENSGVLYKQGSEIELKCENGKFVFRVGLTTLVSNSTTNGVVQVTAVRERNGVLKLYLNKKLDSGTKGSAVLYDLHESDVSVFNKEKVKVYAKALAYDEV